jgi:hypothetical protein
MATEYSDALGRTITYVDVPLEQWRDQELRRRDLPDHVFEYLFAMSAIDSLSFHAHGLRPPTAADGAEVGNFLWICWTTFESGITARAILGCRPLPCFRRREGSTDRGSRRCRGTSRGAEAGTRAGGDTTFLGASAASLRLI